VASTPMAWIAFGTAATAGQKKDLKIRDLSNSS
jgi:hypothetical protein